MLWLHVLWLHMLWTDMDMGIMRGRSRGLLSQDEGSALPRIMTDEETAHRSRAEAAAIQSDVEVDPACFNFCRGFEIDSDIVLRHKISLGQSRSRFSDHDRLDHERLAYRLDRIAANTSTYLAGLLRMPTEAVASASGRISTMLPGAGFGGLDSSTRHVTGLHAGRMQKALLQFMPEWHLQQCFRRLQLVSGAAI